MLKNTAKRYGSVAKGFHWTTSVLVITLLIVGAVMVYLPKPSALRDTVINTHKLVGLLVLAIVIARLTWRLLNRQPRLPEGMPKWMQFASKLSHYGLYILLFIMPFSGWVMASAASKAPHLLGMTFSLPLEHNRALAMNAKEIHEWVAWVLLTFIVVHVLAALYHHLVRKDDVLVRMLPSRDKDEGSAP